MVVMTGDEDPNAIIGTTGADTISGLGGNDSLNGCDTVDAGFGCESMLGGGRNDIYRVANDNDRVTELLIWRRRLDDGRPGQRPVRRRFHFRDDIEAVTGARRSDQLLKLYCGCERRSRSAHFQKDQSVTIAMHFRLIQHQRWQRHDSRTFR
jgi:hypothetical protein